MSYFEELPNNKEEAAAGRNDVRHDTTQHSLLKRFHSLDDVTRLKVFNLAYIGSLSRRRLTGVIFKRKASAADI